MYYLLPPALCSWHTLDWGKAVGSLWQPLHGSTQPQAPPGPHALRLPHRASPGAADLTVATSILALVSLGISQIKCSMSLPAYRGISCQHEMGLPAGRGRDEGRGSGGGGRAGKRMEGKFAGERGVRGAAAAVRDRPGIHAVERAMPVHCSWSCLHLPACLKLMRYSREGLVPCIL